MSVYRVPLVKISMVRDGAVAVQDRVLSDSKRVAKVLWEIIGRNDREEFLVLMLNAKNGLIAVHSVSTGSLSLSIVHPREVYKAVLLSNAAGIILAHNHPSGDPTPSREDRDLTARLVEGGKLLGVRVLDHVVIGESDSCFFSFADNGLL